MISGYEFLIGPLSAAGKRLIQANGQGEEQKQDKDKIIHPMEHPQMMYRDRTRRTNRLVSDDTIVLNYAALKLVYFIIEQPDRRTDEQMDTHAHTQTYKPVFDTLTPPHNHRNIAFK